MMFEGLRVRLQSLVSNSAEVARLRRRAVQLEGEAKANRTTLKRYEETQAAFERRLRAYEAELGRYIPFDRDRAS